MRNYVLATGLEITESEMSDIHRYYEIERTTEYIMEHYHFNEDKARELAELVREKMNDYHLSEEEAIEEVLDELEDDED